MNDSIFEHINYLDFHTHQVSTSIIDTSIQVQSISLGNAIPSSYFTVGIHPWETYHSPKKIDLDLLEQQLSLPKCLGLGEVGLDKLQGASLELQTKFLEQQLEIVRDKNRPVIIHCVRAFAELIAIKKKFPKISNWCIHGYAKNERLAEQLIREGFYLSLRPIATQKKKYQALANKIPIEFLFLETDDKQEPSIEAIYANMAELLAVSIPELQQQITINAQKFFFS